MSDFEFEFDPECEASCTLERLEEVKKPNVEEFVQTCLQDAKLNALQVIKYFAEPSVFNKEPQFNIIGKHFFVVHDVKLFDNETAALLKAEFAKYGFGVQQLWTSWGLYDAQTHKSKQIEEMRNYRRRILHLIFQNICMTVNHNLSSDKPLFDSVVKLPLDAKQYLELHFEKESEFYQKLVQAFSKIGYSSDIRLVYNGEVWITLKHKN